MHYDVVIVGAGPAGLAAAIRLRSSGLEQGLDPSVCIIEKGAEVGAHILSGAVIDPRALQELLPGWKQQGAPIQTPVSDDAFWYLTAGRHYAVPAALLPAAMHNHGNYVVSLANVCRWLAQQAETLGVDIYPGFAAAEILYGDDGAVRGIVTGDAGRDRFGEPGPGFEPGVELYARYTLLAEGCRGSLSQQLLHHFRLDRDSQPQTYALGIKELWEIDPARHRPGRVLHTTGWPLDNDTYGGGWLYHMEDNLVSVGLITGLDYANPYLDPFAEMQCFKTHPSLRTLFAGARRVGYGARVLNEGGLQSIPALVFSGGALIGAAAGFMNVLRLKGSHTAMKSGMLAADAVLAALRAGDAAPGLLQDYPRRLERSWVCEELRRARNVRPAFARWGRVGGMVYTAVDQFLLRGRAPWTLRQTGTDRDRLAPAANCRRIDYAAPDGVVSFDKSSSVYLSSTMHREDEPVHLLIRDEAQTISHNLEVYAAPEQRYCPAGVYEIVEDQAGQRLQINAQNCLHCKACDIKDPSRNIVWTVPEGGGGPRYGNM